MRRSHLLCGALFLLLANAVFGADTLPSAPPRYFNDYANVVSPPAVLSLDKELEQYERETSNQIVVVIYPKMETQTSIEDYAQQLYRAWKIGQKGKDNGALLLVFVQDHKMRIHTGYGLEGALPDILCKQIIDHEIAPLFKQGDYTGGLTAGVNAMMAAGRGEYKGTGTTHAGQHDSKIQWGVILLIIIFVILTNLRRGGGGWYLGGGGYGTWYGGGGGSWGGGFGGGGGGGGFSGGGGSSGGGGASGSW